MSNTKEVAEELGTLYIVSTPIGNLKDATHRSLEVLSDVDLIAAEDTRRTSILLKHYTIKTPLTSFNSYNQVKKSYGLIARLKEGQDLALVSDAGTPGVSDPLYHLVKAALHERVPLVSLPGPSSVLVALTISGLPINRFVFEGFLPRKKGRKKLIEELTQEKRTIVIFESPHRIAKTLNELSKVMGDREAVMAEKKKLKGEITLVISGAPKIKIERTK